MSAKAEGAPRAVRDEETCWIPMADGVRLAARIWFPAEIDAGPAPAIFEYIPYRKRDMTRARDERNHPVFAAHGYVCLRVDMRGSGDSEGVMPDMYAPDELSDARRVIEWIAAQPWCSGRVGMFGTSWGGTASLQAAVDAPTPLAAVLANCATTDRFEDDIHWMGGCLLTDSIEWGATLPSILAAPPDSAVVGEGWRSLWRARLDAATFPLETWMRRNVRGAYWRRGSTRFDAARLSAPALAIGGWSDRYSNSVAPLVLARPDLCWGVVGPWGHHFPDQGAPGPAMDFQALALAWWDHWLKAEAPGPLDWPRLRLWRREFDPPQDRLERRAGGWVAFEAPAADIARTFRLTAGGALSDARAAAGAAAPEQELAPEAPRERWAVPFDVAHGACAGDTGYFGRVGGLPLDQAPDDARALCFDAAPADDEIAFEGAAEFVVTAIRRERAGQLVARLCDVAPDGRSALIVRTARNLALDETLDAETDWAPGRAERVRLRFPTTAYRLKPGHRLRLALAASYWPLIWPTRRDPGVRLELDGAALTVPTLGLGREMAAAAPFAGAAAERPKTWRLVESGALTRAPSRQEGEEGEEGEALRCGWRQAPIGVDYAETGATFRYETAMDYAVAAAEPADARCRARQAMSFSRPDGRADVVSEVVVQSTEDGFRITATLSASFDEEEMLRSERTIEL